VPVAVLELLNDHNERRLWQGQQRKMSSFIHRMAQSDHYWAENELYSLAVRSMSELHYKDLKRLETDTQL
jgi:hypothetical protein